MAIYLLIFFTVFLSVINLIMVRYDYLNPSVIFCLMNLVYSVVAWTVIRAYGIEFHYTTAFVFITGLLIFTLFNLLAKRGQKYKFLLKTNNGIPMTYYEISNIYMIIFILFEIVVSYYMIQYVNEVTRAFYGSSGNFATAIGNYNRIVKNKSDEFSALGIRGNIIYRMGWPMCMAMNSILSVFAINNYIITKKWSSSYKIFISYAFMIIMSFFTGGRSMAFRFITQLFIEYVIIDRWYKGKSVKGSLGFFLKTIVIGAFLLVIIAYSINFIGRSTNIPMFEYLTAYVGGPFVNLDIALDRGISRSDLFAKQTLHHLFQIIGRRLDISEMMYSLNIPYIFIKGHYLGNVYTMYYMYIEDFGLMGVFPCTAIVAWFYNSIYYKLNNVKKGGTCLSPRLFIYGYLFNDLIMLTFSNRFYENALGRQGLFYFTFVIIDWYLLKKGFFIKRVYAIKGNSAT